MHPNSPVFAYSLAGMGAQNGGGWINADVKKGRKRIGCALAAGPPNGKILSEYPRGEEATHLENMDVKMLLRRSF